VPNWTDPKLSKSALVRALHDWWTSHCRPSGVPDRGDFDLPTHRLSLPNILLSEVEDEPFRIRYRLVGTKVVSNLGVDFTGRYLDELLGPSHTIPWVGFYRQSFAERRPVMGKVTDPTESGDTFDYEFGLFPMSHGGTAIRQFIAIEDYFDFNLKSGALVGLL